MKEGETEKTKKYSALCWTEDVITQDVLDTKLLSIKVQVLHKFWSNAVQIFLYYQVQESIFRVFFFFFFFKDLVLDQKTPIRVLHRSVPRLDRLREHSRL